MEKHHANYEFFKNKSIFSRSGDKKMKLEEIDFPEERVSNKVRLRKLKRDDQAAIFDIYSWEESAKLDDWVPFTKIEEAQMLIDKSNIDFINKTELMILYQYF